MKKMLYRILIASLFAIQGAQAEDKGFKISGSVEAGGIGADEDARDAAKLNEHRDLSDGAYGGFDLRGRGARFYLDAFGENLGREDMFFNIQGGIYDQFKFRLYGDWLTHNFGFGPDGARTPFTSPGSAVLTLFANTPAALLVSSVPSWTSFNFSNDRRDLGAAFEFNFKSPWYFLVNANQVRQEGINKVDAAALGTSPGNGFIDLPYPVDYTTRNISGEIGYQKPRGHISVNWMQSNFNNDNLYLKFTNPFFGFGQDVAPFAPGNHYMRIATNGMLRKLPWGSTLSARVTYDRITNSQDMITAVINTAGSAALYSTNPSSLIYEGKVENTTAHVSFASQPALHLDTRAYYNYYDRRNSSTDIVFNTSISGLVCIAENPNSATNLNVPCEGERYRYTKHNPGIEAGYRITPGNRLSGSFDYLDTSRDRFDTEATRERKVFIQWANSSLDAISTRVKYQYMQRRSDFLTDEAGFNANDQFYLERFNRSFDVSNLNQHLLKASVDVTPFKLLDLGFEAYYKRNNYQGLTLGRLNDRRKEFYGSISYGDPENYRVTLFGDVELINYDSYHRTVSSGSPCSASAPNCFDPGTAPTSTAFNWASQLHDKNWTIELGAEWHVVPKLTLKGSALYQETKGGVDFQSQTLFSGAPAALLFPITAYDNTRRWSVNPHLIYQPARVVELSGGYAFDQYHYSDDQFRGYQYTIGTGTSASYLTGIYAFPDYTAHVVYGTLRLSF